MTSVPRYVGRTRRRLEDRLSSHRSARRAVWLGDNNEDLAAWLKHHDPAAIVLDEVAEDTDPWPVEQQWIEKFSSPELLNKNGHDFGRARRKRRGGAESPSAAAA